MRDDNVGPLAAFLFVALLGIGGVIGFFIGTYTMETEAADKAARARCEPICRQGGGALKVLAVDALKGTCTCGVER